MLRRADAAKPRLPSTNPLPPVALAPRRKASPSPREAGRGPGRGAPALLQKITDGFVRSIQDFAEQHEIPVVHFEPDQRKEEIACKHLARFKGDEGVVMIGPPRTVALFAALCGFIATPV